MISVLDKLRLEKIKSTISEIPFVSKINRIEQGELFVSGNIEIAFEELENPLFFDFLITQEYPLKTYSSESITFFNADLIQYNHVMANGNICIHTAHSEDLENKIWIDFNALKAWIIKYYINKEKDQKYEHLVVQDSAVNGDKYSFTFTSTGKVFQEGEIGIVKLSLLHDGYHKKDHIYNFYVQYFETFPDLKKNCFWNDFYFKQPTDREGIYLFRENPPAKYNRFAHSTWAELDLPQDILTMLREFQDKCVKEDYGKIIPFFLGYKINSTEIHWQVALMEVGKFPIKGIPERNEGKKTGRWYTGIDDTPIHWGISRNASYEYFFGRGKFCDAITEAKILIIGVGAVGSMIATTLTRSGCRFIDFIDHDVKEPENVCRSEYRFSKGINNKILELVGSLYEISPFVTSHQINNDYFEKYIKSFYTDENIRAYITADLDKYDIIFDCSTDNDLMYVLNKLTLHSKLINISLTNHANELVCAFYPNIYNFVNNQFSNVLENDVSDMYEPTGCWSPTFKASYNDIALLVQMALKQINRIFSGEKAFNNFVIQENNSSFKIIEY
jgi:hypothetical protein